MMIMFISYIFEGRPNVNTAGNITLPWRRSIEHILRSGMAWVVDRRLALVVSGSSAGGNVSVDTSVTMPIMREQKNRYQVFPLTSASRLCSYSGT